MDCKPTTLNLLDNQKAKIKSTFEEKVGVAISIHLEDI